MEDDGVNLSQVEPIDPTLPPTASNTRYPLPRLFKVVQSFFARERAWCPSQNVTSA